MANICQRVIVHGKNKGQGCPNEVIATGKKYCYMHASYKIRDPYALCKAAKDGRLDDVKRLISNGADIHINAHNNLAIRVAADNNHLDIVKYLVSKGADAKSAIKSATENGQSAVAEVIWRMSI